MDTMTFTTEIDENAACILHRNNHSDEKSWALLGLHEDGFHPGQECYLSIGCGSGKLSPADYRDIRDAAQPFGDFERIYAEKVQPGGTKRRHSLYKFLFLYKPGDYLVIPQGAVFHVFRVAGEVEFLDDVRTQLCAAGYDPEQILAEQADLAFFRRVEPVKLSMERRQYAWGALASAMRYRGTVLYLSEAAKSGVAEAIKAEAGISFAAEMSNSLIGTLVEQLQRLTDTQFESLICWYFLKLGADEASVLPKRYAGKQGQEDTDVFAQFNALNLRIYVQAKAFRNTADLNWACRQIAGYKQLHVTDWYEYTNIFWVVTSAVHLEYDAALPEQENIRIIDGEEFAQMLLDVGFRSMDAVFR